VSFRQLSRLARRQWIVVLVTFLVLLSVAYDFKKAPQTFEESGTLVLVSDAPNPYSGATPDVLIDTGAILVKWLDGPVGQSALDRAGIAAGFDVALVNFSSEQYPAYDQPYLTVSAESLGAAADEQEFTAGIGIFNAELASLQKEAGARSADFITTKLIGVSGPVEATGSSKRVYGGLLILGVVAAFLAAQFFDKRGIRFRRGRQAQ
jgi:hypothetical protein